MKKLGVKEKKRKFRWVHVSSSDVTYLRAAVSKVLELTRLLSLGTKSNTFKQS